MEEVIFELYRSESPNTPRLIRASYTVINPGSPAQIYGPPESCYPGEDMEWELNSVELILYSNQNYSRDIMHLLTAEDHAIIEDEVLSNIVLSNIKS